MQERPYVNHADKLFALKLGELSQGNNDQQMLVETPTLHGVGNYA